MSIAGGLDRAVERAVRVGATALQLFLKNSNQCHVFAAGYDLGDPAAVAATLAEFERIIGLDRLRLIHINDSKTPLGARRDRHEHIGQGQIGTAGLAALLRDPRLGRVPFILETPQGEDLEEDRMNLATLRRLWAEGA